MVILSTLLYGSDTWAPLATCETFARLLDDSACAGDHSVSNWEERRNTDLRAMAGLERVDVMCMKRKLRRFGHIAWMKETRIIKWLLLYKTSKRQAVCRWSEEVKELCNSRGSEKV